MFGSNPVCHSAEMALSGRSTSRHQHLMVDHVARRPGAWQTHFNARKAAYAGQCDIELARGKYRARKVYAHSLLRLTLAAVDCHSEGHAHGELKPPE